GRPRESGIGNRLSMVDGRWSVVGCRLSNVGYWLLVIGPIRKSGPTTDDRCSTPDSRFPIPDPRFPIPDLRSDSKVADVAVLHDVFLPLDAELSDVAGGVPGSGGDEVVVRDDLGADEGLL